MMAMRLHAVGEALRFEAVPSPLVRSGQVMVRVLACGVCRTDLHIVDGELSPHLSPIIPGHEVVGRIVNLGSGVEQFSVGQRVGIPWLGHVCGHCRYCMEDHENLCDTPGFTGYDYDGGYAEFAAAEAAFCIPLPDSYSDWEIAPLLCAGLIGYRSYRAAGEARVLGLVGFGAAAHIICQVALADGRTVFALTKPGDRESQEFAMSLGCQWAGGTDQAPPLQLDAAIIFAPSGPLIPQALQMVRKGGHVICAGIHMTDVPQFPYAHLWGERRVSSVANLTRDDGREFFARAAQQKIRTTVRTYALAEANAALTALRTGQLQGAAVLIP